MSTVSIAAREQRIAELLKEQCIAVAEKEEDNKLLSEAQGEQHFRFAVIAIVEDDETISRRCMSFGSEILSQKTANVEDDDEKLRLMENASIADLNIMRLVNELPDNEDALTEAIRIKQMIDFGKRLGLNKKEENEEAA